MKSTSPTSTAIALAFAASLTVACHDNKDPETPDPTNEGAAEEAGEAVDEAAEDAADEAEDAADEAEDAAEDVSE